MLVPRLAADGATAVAVRLKRVVAGFVVRSWSYMRSPLRGGRGRPHAPPWLDAASFLRIERRRHRAGDTGAREPHLATIAGITTGPADYLLSLGGALPPRCA